MSEVHSSLAECLRSKHARDRRETERLNAGKIKQNLEGENMYECQSTCTAKLITVNQLRWQLIADRNE